MWELDYKENWVLKNWCFSTVVLEKTLESPLDCKIKPVNSKGNQCWIFIARTDVEYSNTLATWYKELMHWKRPWCWERLKAGREVDDRGWDGWMASPTRWARLWVNSGRWTGRPSMLQSMGSQSQTRLSDWAELRVFALISILYGRQGNSYYPVIQQPSLLSCGSFISLGFIILSSFFFFFPITCTAGRFFTNWAIREAA